MLIKRLFKLAVLAAVASAIASAVKMATQGSPQHDAASPAAGSVDTWPEVPRNPDAS
ncbi:MAG TPA: hypothetical protein VGZ03_10560 [Acidimicrobiales bacterium]|jgi:hypothetical protein|nr:hypothetical protein [Acidimicrobiales bacterium]